MAFAVAGASSKALSAAEQKSRGSSRKRPDPKEMQEADAEIAKQTHLKSEITKSIVNMQELQRQSAEQVDESLGVSASNHNSGFRFFGRLGRVSDKLDGLRAQRRQQRSQQPYACQGPPRIRELPPHRTPLGAPLQPLLLLLPKRGHEGLLGGFDGFEAAPAPVAAPVDLLGGDMAHVHERNGYGWRNRQAWTAWHDGRGTGMGNPFGQSQTAPQGILRRPATLPMRHLAALILHPWGWRRSETRSTLRRRIPLQGCSERRYL